MQVKVCLLGCVIAVTLFSSCNTARRVPDGQYLLTHNTILYPAAKAAKGIEKTLTRQFAGLKIPTEISPQFIQAYIKQKPNTKILGLIPLHLLVYNLVNPEKAEEKKFERDQRIDRKNKERIAKGKKALSDEQIRAKKQRRTFREWLMGAGEPPVILDSELMNASLKQIRLFLQSKGYYDCKVRDSVSAKNKKAKVFYIIRPGKPYKINTIEYTCEDSAILPLIYGDSANCLINKGDNYDRDALMKERDRITHFMNDNGYYAFSKEYIKYEIDSNAGTHQMNVGIRIKKFVQQDTVNPDSLIESSHPVFHIRNVFVQMQYNPSVPTYAANDTTVCGDYTVVYPNGQIGFKPNRLLSKVFIKKGDIYRVSNVDYTYTGLAQLKTFRYIGVKFVPAGDHNLDCYIQLMPTLKQSIGVEAVGKNTGGDLGIQGDLVYENKNLFKGCEVLQFKIKGGLEAQKLLSSQSSNKGINNIIQLNTIDIGPELDFAIPRALFPFNLGANIDTIDRRVFHHKTSFGLWPKANPQTVLKVTYDYQNRPLDYARHVFGLAYTFNYNPYDKLNRWHVELKFPEINYVHATLFPSFQNALINTNNFFLLNSFTNHLITDLGISFIFNNQVLAKLHNFQFIRMSFEESGALLRTINNLSSHTPDENHTIAGVPYTHYLKEELDIRDYVVLSKDDKLAFRALFGFGQPLKNFDELPFDKSFWGGGSNDIRAWQARSLGPGGYAQENIIDQIGDIKLEGNVEYRFNVIKLLGLAIFADAGNIWLLNSNPAVPNGNFNFSGQNAFYNQFAVGTGIGIRLDFTYFVFRFDFGYPLRDPSKAKGKEWTTWHELNLDKTVLNLGIGYPF